MGIERYENLAHQRITRSKTVLRDLKKQVTNLIKGGQITDTKGLDYTTTNLFLQNTCDAEYDDRYGRVYDPRDDMDEERMKSYQQRLQQATQQHIQQDPTPAQPPVQAAVQVEQQSVSSNQLATFITLDEYHSQFIDLLNKQPAEMHRLMRDAKIPYPQSHELEPHYRKGRSVSVCVKDYQSKTQEKEFRRKRI